MAQNQHYSNGLNQSQGHGFVKEEASVQDNQLKLKRQRSREVPGMTGLSEPRPSTQTSNVHLLFESKQKVSSPDSDQGSSDHECLS